MNILCFGDSNTYGYDPRSFFGDRYPSEDRWTDLLAQKTGLETINAGVNGETIPAGPYALRSVGEHVSADILLVMLGTNDLLQGASAREAAARMESFLTRLFPHFQKMLLVAPPPMKRGAWVPTEELVSESVLLAQEYEVLSRKLQLPFADTRGWNIELTFDGVHFTEAGHHAFAARLADYLDRHGFASDLAANKLP